MNCDRGKQHDSTDPGRNRPTSVAASAVYVWDDLGAPPRWGNIQPSTDVDCEQQRTVGRHLFIQSCHVPEQSCTTGINELLYMWQSPPSAVTICSSLHAQLCPNEVFVEMLMTRWWFDIVSLNKKEMPLQYPSSTNRSAVALSNYRQIC